MPSPPEAAPLLAEAITDAAALERLRPAWQALWRQAPEATPFQSPEWLIPWWRHVGEGELLTLAIRRPPAEALVGLVPLYIHTQPDGRRLVFPLGMGTTDYLDALALPGQAAVVMDCAFRHLAARRARWDACEWPQLREGAVLLAGEAPPGWQDQRAEGAPCPFLPLPQSRNAPIEAIPPRMWQNLRTARHRAERQGRLHWERATAASLADLFEAQLDLHRARWVERGESGVLAAPAVQAAHREALPGLLANGTLRLHALRLEGRVIATLYALADRPGIAARRVYFYLSGFDPRFAALSPGALALEHAIHDAVAEGATGFDFLRGGEAYKYRWGARDAPTFRRLVQPAPEDPPD